MIAALYVARNGVYYGLPDVECWDEERDARLYAGPWPVVAHPPCSRWCMLTSVVEARHPHLRGKYTGQDDGCFASALAAVRRWGGVLEHPAFTKAFKAYGIPAPHKTGWQATLCGGWVCQIDQAFYGHRARKRTWLYAHSVVLPDMRWGNSSSSVWMTWLKRDGKGNEMRPPTVERMGKKERNATSLKFRDVLLNMARSVKQ